MGRASGNHRLGGQYAAHRRADTGANHIKTRAEHSSARFYFYAARFTASKAPYRRFPKKAGRLGPANTPYLLRLSPRRHSARTRHRLAVLSADKTSLRRSIPRRSLRVLLHSKICCAYFAD